MQTRLSVLFYGKRAKTTTEGKLPIYMRITINGQRIEVSTQRHIETKHWSSAKGKMAGGTGQAMAFNNYLDVLKNQVYDYQTELLQEGKEVNCENMRNKIFKVAENQRMLLEVFKEHNAQMGTLVNTEFSKGTLVNFKTTLKHVTNFMKWKYNVSDIDIRKVDNAFVADFDFYLRSVVKTANNSTVKNIRNFGKVVRICMANGWLETNPFTHYKGKMREVKRGFLSQAELDAIVGKDFVSERLTLVKDIFVFSCYTGLAYIDVQNLSASNIALGIDGEKWIFTHRQKTDTSANIPLLPVAREILEKYRDHPQCISKNCLLPILSNQKMNAYLKEIADVCGIGKELTFHIARHTFATTVTLSNGVPIESVSKMLGHCNIKQTQHYAKVLDKKVSSDMLMLRSKLEVVQAEPFSKTGT